VIAKNDVFVVSAVRTPIGSKNGYLRNWTAPELLGAALDEAIHRIDLDPELVDEVVTGCVYQLGEQGFNIARGESSPPDCLSKPPAYRSTGNAAVASRLFRSLT